MAYQLTLDDSQTYSVAYVAVAGAHDVPPAVAEAAACLVGSRGEDAIFSEAAEKAVAAVDPSPDVYGSADLRRRMVRVLSRRALGEAWQQA